MNHNDKIEKKLRDGWKPVKQLPPIGGKLPSTKVSMAMTSSLSDARIDAEEIWAEVGNYPLNNMSTVKDNQEFDKLTYALALNDNSFVKAFMQIYSTINNRSAD